MHERTAIYCRLSEEDTIKEGGESQSIQNQKQLLRQYAARHGWDITAEFSDDDYAGADRSRPGFRALLEGAEQGQYDIILCKTQSRFTREMELVEHYLHDCFPRWGVRFVSVVDHADTAVQGNKKARQINGLINEWYLEDLSDNIRAVLTSRRKSGLHIGSTALYGYQKDSDHRGHLIPDPQTAWVVRQIFDWFLAGDSQRTIAQRLNLQGVPCPSACKGRQDTVWRDGAVRTILHNEMYRGCLVQGRYGSESYKTRRNRARPKTLWYRVENTHEPLVSAEQWTRVQEKIRAHTRPCRKGQAGAFSGLVFCAACGHALCVTSTRGVRYLHCTAQGCKGAFVSEQALGEAITMQVTQFMKEYLTDDKIKILREKERQGQKADAQDRRYHTQIDRLEKSLHLLYLDRAAGRISEEAAQPILECLTCEKAQAEQELIHLQTMPVGGTYRTWNGTHDQMQHLIRRIEVGRRRTGENTVTVEVFWRF